MKKFILWRSICHFTENIISPFKSEKDIVRLSAMCTQKAKVQIPQTNTILLLQLNKQI